MNGASGAGTWRRKFGSSAGMPACPSWGAGDTAVTGASAVTPCSLAAQRGQRSGGWSVAGLVATRALQNWALLNMALIQAWANGLGERKRVGEGKSVLVRVDLCGLGRFN